MEVSKVLRNDLVCSGVQLSGLLFLWLQQMLSAQAVFWLMALSTGCGAVVGALQCRVVFVADISGLRQALTDNWRFGRWVLGTNVAWYASTQLYLLLAGALLGLRGPAILEASRTIMAPTQILYFATGNVLPSLGARRLHADGPKALRRLVRLVTVAMMIAMGAYGLMVILAPEFLLGLFYGGQYTGYGGVVQLYALMYFLMNSTLVFSLGIDSLARPDRTFLITMCAGVVALVVAFPLVRWWDVYGAALGMVVTQTVVLGGAWCLFEVSLRERAEAITPVGNG
jgi:O-antigen/teichoic acid export membrane protein